VRVQNISMTRNQMVRGCKFSERGMGRWKISSFSISGASKIDRHMCLCVVPPPPPHSPSPIDSYIYLTTSPFSNATFPRRTNAVTSVRLPTPRFAKSLSRRNISTFCFGCLCLLAPVAAGPFFDEDVFFPSSPSFSLAERLLLLLLLPPVLRVRRPFDGW